MVKLQVYHAHLGPGLEGVRKFEEQHGFKYTMIIFHNHDILQRRKERHIYQGLFGNHFGRGGSDFGSA